MLFGAVARIRAVRLGLLREHQDHVGAARRHVLFRPVTTGPEGGDPHLLVDYPVEAKLARTVRGLILLRRVPATEVYLRADHRIAALIHDPARDGSVRDLQDERWQLSRLPRPQLQLTGVSLTEPFGGHAHRVTQIGPEARERVAA